MRGQERELILLRSDNGETWKEHQYEWKTRDLQELLAGMDEGVSLRGLENFPFSPLALRESRINLGPGAGLHKASHLNHDQEICCHD